MADYYFMILCNVQVGKKEEEEEEMRRKRRRKEKERRVRDNVENPGCEQVDIADLFVLIERFVCWEASN